MRQNPDFIMTDVADNHVLVPVGEAAANFKSIINLNDMGQTIWNMLENETTLDEILKNILAEYDVSEQQARTDIEAFVTKLRETGCITE
ncbi:MAG: PqqD family protein [Eubacteriales bacterium]|nr:PqqD family protein [Eubacteriales bacterium]